uniref:NADH dehydrogenase subunit 6 n=1 Tax=Succinea putris TaxID=145427 RepID=G8HSG3_9EUPU|nr:NADH dehydrogenase subunit 6 [Succinea putris]AEQ93924.1 NADH dehydrogenase subunit 6 [Succinea putris]
MKFDIMLLSLVMIMFIIFFNPLIMGCCLFLLSLMLIKSLGMMSSVWFAYLMFMVYIGGMLVLFIYICMVTSNYKFLLTFSTLGIFIEFSLLLLILMLNLILPSKFFLCSSQGMTSFPMFLMYVMIFFLLVIFFSIVHIIFKKNISMKNDF